MPELDKIKSDVTAAWKFAQARESAKAAAEEAKTQAAESGRALAELVGDDRQIIKPPAFSYFDYLSVMMFRWQGQPLEYGEIKESLTEEEAAQRDPIVIEGKETDAIKKALINAPVGETVVVSDESKSTYYAVRIISAEGTGEKGRQEFMQAIVDNPGQGPPMELALVSRYDLQEMLMNWTQQIEKEYDVEWLDAEYRQQATRES